MIGPILVWDMEEMSTGCYPLVMTNSWLLKPWPFSSLIFPAITWWFPVRYVSLPEGNPCSPHSGPFYTSVFTICLRKENFRASDLGQVGEMEADIILVSGWVAFRLKNFRPIHRIGAWKSYCLTRNSWLKKKMCFLFYVHETPCKDW
jgi:hypothetical protein